MNQQTGIYLQILLRYLQILAQYLQLSSVNQQPQDLPTNSLPISTNFRFKSTNLKLVSTNFSLRSEEHTSELQSRFDLVCRLLLERNKRKEHNQISHQQPEQHMTHV